MKNQSTENQNLNKDTGNGAGQKSSAGHKSIAGHKSSAREKKSNRDGSGNPNVQNQNGGDQQPGQEADDSQGIQQSKLAVMPVGKLLLSLALPAIAAQVVNLLYNMVDRIYIGHIEGVGSLALTGVGVTFPVIMLIAAFSALIGFGGAPRASIAMGKGENDKAEEILGNCVCTLVALSLVLTLVFFIFAKPILFAFGASEETIIYAYPYIRIYVIGTLFVQVTTGLNAFITSQGFASVGMKTVMIGAVINLVLDPVFIFVFNMGVSGAALATILSQAVSAAWVIKFLCSKKTMLRIKKKYLRFTPKIMGPVLALGVSPFIMQSTESLLNICFNTSLLKYGGNLAVGSMTILSSVMQTAMMPVQGITQGMQPIVSFNYGAGNMHRVRKAFLLTLASCVAYTFLLWSIAMLFPQTLARIFSSDVELIEYTQWALRIYMAAACIFGAQLACQQTFVALGKAVHSLFLAILRKIVLLIPLIFILPMFFENKVFGVFLAEPVSDIIAVCTTVTMFGCTAWKLMKDKKIPEGKTLKQN